VFPDASTGTGSTLFFFCPFAPAGAGRSAEMQKEPRPTGWNYPIIKYDLVVRAGKKIKSQICPPDRTGRLPRTCHRATPHLAQATAPVLSNLNLEAMIYPTSIMKQFSFFTIKINFCILIYGKMILFESIL
jgi:hypothetical protein